MDLLFSYKGGDKNMDNVLLYFSLKSPLLSSLLQSFSTFYFHILNSSTILELDALNQSIPEYSD